MAGSPKRRRDGGKRSKADKSWLRPWHFAALLFALALLLYSPALNGPLVLDDYDMTEGGSAVRLGQNLAIMRSGRPLLMWTFVLNHRLAGGFHPFPFHLTNVLLHGLNAFLVWLFAGALFDKAVLSDRVRAFRSLFVYGLPLLFLASPIQTESVAYISSRSEVLAATFYIAGLLAFVRLRDRNAWLTAAAVMLCFAGAALSKQDKLTLPAAVLLVDYLLLSGCDWRGLKKSWPTYGLFGVGVVAGFFVVVRPFLFARTAGFGLDWQEYLFTQFRVVFRYMRQTLVPFGLNVDPDIQASASLGDHLSWLALLALVALVAAAIWFHKRAPVPVFGLLFFLLVLAPTTTFFPLADFAAERRLYLPALGFYLALLWVMTRVFEPGAAAARWTLAALIGVYAAGTYQRSGVWSDEVRLWSDAVAKSPEKERPWTWLGRAYYSAGNLPQAQIAWNRAAELVEKGSDQEAFLLGNLGLLEARAQRWEQAIAYYKRALEAKPRETTLYAQLAVAQIRAGRPDEGWETFAKAQKAVRTVSPQYRILRGQEYFQIGEYEKAAQDFQQALASQPEDQETRRNLEIARRAAGLDKD
jgi:tetratricopeptide (TPR) repeat protein